VLCKTCTFRQMLLGRSNQGGMGLAGYVARMGW